MSAATPTRVLTLALIPLQLAACAGVGPAALDNGRGAYSDVINRTEDQQILEMIVRQRYDETFGMLAVTSVTASLKVGATAGGNVGIGPRSGYEGNLVPFSASAMYEDNPTISYVPIRGEQFVEHMLAPVSAEQTLLLSRMSSDQLEVLPLLLRRANGIANPLYASERAGVDGAAFDRFIELYTGLRERGKLDIVAASEGQYELLIHDFSDGDTAAVDELLRLLGLERPSGPGPGEPISLPLRFLVGSPRSSGIDFETPSALEVMQAAADGVVVPDEHLTAGFARIQPAAAASGILTVQSSPDRPADASVAVRHHGWWFYVDARDARSKQGFMFLRTLIGLRLDESSSKLGGAPVLTVPAR